MVTTSERRRRVWAGAHRKQDTVGVREDDAGGDAGAERRGRGVLLERWRIDGILRWCRRAVGVCLELRGIFTFSASSLTSRVPRLDGLSTRKRLRRFSQSVDM